MIQFEVVVLCCFLRWVYGSERPVIGILAQETKSSDPNRFDYGSYISASYVKAVEASGARVVPVFIDRDRDYYEELGDKLNGYVFPGGAADITADTGYARSGRIVYELVSKLNGRGRNVPILGVCLGMELLGLISLGGEVRTPCPVKNEALNLVFLPGYESSSLYANLSTADFETLSEKNSTSHHHRYCLTQETLSRYPDSQWDVLTTSKGRNSTVFISSMEMKSRPIAGVIFHPEKCAFEWKSTQANPHDPDSVAAAAHFYSWLVRESRKNDNIYPSANQVMNDLIENYNAVFTGKKGLYDFQNYYFK